MQLLRSSATSESRRPAAPTLLLLGLLAGALPACGGGDEGGGNKPTQDHLASDADLADEAFKSGVEFANEGIFPRAIEEFQRAISFDSSNVDYWLALGEVFGRLGYPTQAQQAFQGGLNADPTNPVLYAKLGVIAVQNSETQRGVELLKKALEYDDSLAEIHFRLGQALAYLSDVKVGSRITNYEQLDEAIAELRRAIELDGLNDEYPFWLGRILERRGEPEQALESYRRAIELNPDHLEAQLRLANMLIERGDAEEGTQHLEKARAIDPNEPRIYFELGVLAEQSEDLAAARAAYERCVELSPAEVDGYFRLANVLRQLGEEEEAASVQETYDYWAGLRSQYEYWHQEAKAKPDDPEVFAQLGEMSYLLMREEEAVQWLKRSWQLDRENGMVNAYLGIIFQKNGNAIEGQPLLEKAVELGIDGEDVLRALAATMMDQSKFGEARDVFARLAAETPDEPSNHYNMGVASLNLAELDVAAEHLHKAIALNPSYARAHFALGTVHLQQKDFEQAAAEYRVVLQLEPENQDAQSALAQALAGDQG